MRRARIWKRFSRWATAASPTRIELAWQRGQIFDAWDEYLNCNRWMQAFADTGVDVHYFANRHKAYDEPLPWDHIDCGVTKGYLRAEDKNAPVRPRLTADCHTEPCTFCRPATALTRKALKDAFPTSPSFPTPCPPPA